MSLGLAFFGFLPGITTQRARTLDGLVQGYDPEFAADVDLALVESGLTRKEAAFVMYGAKPSSESRLCSALAGREHLSLWHLAKLPQAFHAALWSIRLRRIGYDILPPGTLRELVADVRALLGTEGRKAGAA